MTIVDEIISVAKVQGVFAGGMVTTGLDSVLATEQLAQRNANPPSQ